MLEEDRAADSKRIAEKVDGLWMGHGVVAPELGGRRPARRTKDRLGHCLSLFSAVRDLFREEVLWLLFQTCMCAYETCVGIAIGVARHVLIMADSQRYVVSTAHATRHGPVLYGDR